MNSSLSTSSDLLSPLFLLSLSPGVSSFSFIPLLLFSSLSSFIIYAALFSPCSPHFLISFLGCNHALLTGVLFYKRVFTTGHILDSTVSLCIPNWQQLMRAFFIISWSIYKAVQLVNEHLKMTTVWILRACLLFGLLCFLLKLRYQCSSCGMHSTTLYGELSEIAMKMYYEYQHVLCCIIRLDSSFWPLWSFSMKNAQWWKIIHNIICSRFICLNLGMV